MSACVRLRQYAGPQSTRLVLELLVRCVRDIHYSPWRGRVRTSLLGTPSCLLLLGPKPQDNVVTCWRAGPSLWSGAFGHHRQCEVEGPGQEGQPCSQQRLILASKLLGDGHALSEFNIQRDCLIQLGRDGRCKQGRTSAAD